MRLLRLRLLRLRLLLWGPFPRTACETNERRQRYRQRHLNALHAALAFLPDAGGALEVVRAGLAAIESFSRALILLRQGYLATTRNLSLWAACSRSGRQLVRVWARRLPPLA